MDDKIEIETGTESEDHDSKSKYKDDKQLIEKNKILFKGILKDNSIQFFFNKRRVSFSSQVQFHNFGINKIKKIDFKRRKTLDGKNTLNEVNKNFFNNKTFNFLNNINTSDKITEIFSVSDKLKKQTNENNEKNKNFIDFEDQISENKENVNNEIENYKTNEKGYLIERKVSEITNEINCKKKDHDLVLFLPEKKRENDFFINESDCKFNNQELSENCSNFDILNHSDHNKNFVMDLTEIPFYNNRSEFFSYDNQETKTEINKLYFNEEENMSLEIENESMNIIYNSNSPFCHESIKNNVTSLLKNNTYDYEVNSHISDIKSLEDLDNRDNDDDNFNLTYAISKIITFTKENNNLNKPKIEKCDDTAIELFSTEKNETLDLIKMDSTNNEYNLVMFNKISEISDKKTVDSFVDVDEIFDFENHKPMDLTQTFVSILKTKDDNNVYKTEQQNKPLDIINEQKIYFNHLDFEKNNMILPSLSENNLIEKSCVNYSSNNLKSLSDFFSEIGFTFCDDLDIEVNSIHENKISNLKKNLNVNDDYWIDLFPKIDLFQTYFLSCVELNNIIKMNKNNFETVNNLDNIRTKVFFNDYYRLNNNEKLNFKTKLQLIKDYSQNISKTFWYDWKTNLMKSLNQKLNKKSSIINDFKTVLYNINNEINILHNNQSIQINSIQQKKKILTKLKSYLKKKPKDFIISLKTIKKDILKFKLLNDQISDKKKQLNDLKNEMQIKNENINREINKNQINSLEVKLLLFNFNFLEEFTSLKFLKVQNKSIYFHFKDVFIVNIDSLENEIKIKYSFMESYLNSTDINNRLIYEKYANKLPNLLKFNNIIENFQQFKKLWGKFKQIDNDIFLISLKCPVFFIDSNELIKFYIKYYNFIDRYQIIFDCEIILFQIINYSTLPILKGKFINNYSNLSLEKIKKNIISDYFLKQFFINLDFDNLFNHHAS